MVPKGCTDGGEGRFRVCKEAPGFRPSPREEMCRYTMSKQSEDARPYPRLSQPQTYKPCTGWSDMTTRSSGRTSPTDRCITRPCWLGNTPWQEGR